MNNMFEYSTCQICYKPIMREPTAPKPSWFHIPSWEYEQPDHKPKVNE